ncbi:MAG: LamG-like jellyroll fold domain-containing protein [Candidatus Paceibacterota bacterium]
MSKKLLIIFSLVILATVGSFLIFKSSSEEGKIEEAEAAALKSGLTLDLNFGNNNGAAAPIIYDTSGNKRHATSTNGVAPACGTNDCTFPAGGYFSVASDGVFNFDQISIAFNFTPTFDADDGLDHVLLDAVSGTTERYLVYKVSVALGNGLRLYLGNTGFADVALAVYKPLWKKGQENILVITGTTGNTKIYLNGVMVKSITTAWTPDNPTNLVIGNYYGKGTGLDFNGKMKWLKVWNRLLTDTEVANLSADRETFIKAPKKEISTSGKLMGWWTMDANDLGTKMFDKSGNSKNANANNISSDDVAQGKINQAVDLNGTNEYFSVIDDPIFNFTAQATVSLWVKSTSTGWGHLFYKGGSSYLNLVYDTDGLIEFRIKDGGTTYSSGNGPYVFDNQWHHVVGTYDGSTVKIYGDGVLLNSAGHVGDMDTTTGNLIFPGPTQYTSYLKCLMDDVRIYNYALSAQEISDLYNSAKTKYTSSAPKSGLVSWWTMDTNDTNGTKIYDKSGFKNTAVAVASPTSAKGKINQGVYFNGTTQYLSAADSSSLSPANITLSAWIKPTTIDSTADAIMGKTSDWTWLDGYGLDMFDRYHVGKNLVFWINDYWDQCVSSTISVGNWYHVVGTYDRSNIKLYKNGTLVDSRPYTTAINYLASTFEIGRLSVNEFNFNGSIDDIRVYNRALSAQEIAQLYNSAKTNYVK